MQKYTRKCLVSLLLLVPLVLHAQIQVDWSRTIEESHGAVNAVAGHDGGYVIAAFGGPYSAVKIGTEGNVEWHQDYGNALWNLIKAPDSGYVLVGEQFSQQWNSYVVELIRTDNTGNTIWRRTYADSSDNEAGSICTTGDGGYALVTQSYNDIWLIRMNSMGDTVWTHRYDINLFDDIYFYDALTQTIDGGFVLAGATQDASHNYDMFLLKTGATGTIEWVETYGEANTTERANIVRVLHSGYLIGGMRRSDESGASPQAYLIRVDLSGDIIWEQGYNTFEGITTQPSPVTGGWLLTGSTREFSNSNDAYIIQIDSSGVLQWDTTIGTDSTDEFGGPILSAGEFTYVMAGTKRDIEATQHLWVTQFTVDSITGIVTNPQLPLPGSVHLFANYPNPFNPATTIAYELPPGEWYVRLSVYDVAGRRVRTLVQSTKSRGAYQVQWNGQDHVDNPVASGTYLARLTVESPAGKVISIRTRKMIVLR